MSHDMQSMHDAADEAFQRRLLQRGPFLRGVANAFREAYQISAGRALTRPDEAGIAEPRSDSGSGESAGISK